MMFGHVSSVFYSVALLVLLVGKSHAQPYKQWWPPAGGGLAPPDAGSGKYFPQWWFCSDPSSKCYGKFISCPRQCPAFKPYDTKAKGCFIDCNSINCEAVCKNRRPNCNGIGSACYDPRFVGGDGVMFFFHGESNQHFALVSDADLHINARFIGVRPAGRPRDNTWIQALGLLFNSHSFTLAAQKVPRWNDDIDHLRFTYDGVSIAVPDGHLSSWSAADSGLLVERAARCNSVTVTLPGVVHISVNVVPVTEEDDRIHGYHIPADDCFAHLEVQFKLFNLSDRVEGVLGQTYRPDFENPVKRGVPMPVMGGEDKYLTSSLFSADCKFCIYGGLDVSGSDPGEGLFLDSA
ncbi:hypothetical protein Ancab_023891 [Ancistrocladus abbreviatus]